MAPPAPTPSQQLHEDEGEYTWASNVRLTSSDAPPESFPSITAEQDRQTPPNRYRSATASSGPPSSIAPSSPTYITSQWPHNGSTAPSSPTYITSQWPYNGEVVQYCPSNLTLNRHGFGPEVPQIPYVDGHLAPSASATSQYRQCSHYPFPYTTPDGLLPMDKDYMTGMDLPYNHNSVAHVDAHSARSQFIPMATSRSTPASMTVSTPSSSNITLSSPANLLAAEHSPPYQHAPTNNGPSLRSPRQGSATSTGGRRRRGSPVALPAVRNANERRRTRAANYECERCDQNFTTKHSYRRHCRSHNKRKN